jgi:biotin transporter BioY
MQFPKVLQVVFAAIFISLFAQIEIALPLNEVGIDISGQTFAVLLVGFLLGPIYGPLAVVLYIILGAIGLPVFSGGSAGLDKLWGSSAGYLLGFILGAYVVGILGERGWGKRLDQAIFAMTLGTLIILFTGTLRLALIHGVSKAVEYGFYPFLLGGVVKVILGGVAAYVAERLLRFR